MIWISAVHTTESEKKGSHSERKCEYNKTQIEFYGHGFTAKDPPKIEAALKTDAPRKTSGVGSLLGLTNYCGSKFIRKDYYQLSHTHTCFVPGRQERGTLELDKQT